MNKYELIDSIITSLNDLTVKGVHNMNIVVDSIAKLAGLSDGMKKADQALEARFNKLKKLLEEHGISEDDAPAEPEKE